MRSSWLRMRPFCVALFCCFQAQHQHVEDDPDVDYYNQQSKPVGAPRQIGCFEGDVDGSGGERQPFCPGTDMPQSVCLYEAKRHVDSGHGGDLPQAHVADPVH